MEENKDQILQSASGEHDVATPPKAHDPAMAIKNFIIARRWLLVCVALLFLTVRLEAGLAEARSYALEAEYRASRAQDAAEAAQATAHEANKAALDPVYEYDLRKAGEDARQAKSIASRVDYDLDKLIEALRRDLSSLYYFRR